MIDFLASPWVAETLFVYIRGRLQASSRCGAAATSGETRTPKPGELHDIEHMAAFMPHVDVLSADQFFAGIANQNNLRLGKKFNITIRSLLRSPHSVVDGVDRCGRNGRAYPHPTAAARYREAR